MKLTVALAGCAVVMLCPLLFAQKQEPPRPGPARDFVLPAKKTLTLDNGLVCNTVVFGELPKASVLVVGGVGSIDEAADQVWLTTLVGEYLKEGTTTRSAEAVARLAASMGGSIAVSTGENQTAITADVLSEFAPDAIRLLADVVSNPAFPESELPRLVNDMVRQVSVARTVPQSIGEERFRRALYGDHPYGRVFPSEETLRSFTVEDVRVFHAAHFHASRTRVYVVGRFDTVAVDKAVMEAFGDMAAGVVPESEVPSPNSRRVVHVVDRPGAPQSSLRLGLPVIDPSHPDYTALQVTNTLLGGAFTSRITSNIREDKGYTYSPGSLVSSRYRDAYWIQLADVATPVTGPALKEIFYEIERLQNEAPPAEELDGVKRYMSGTFVLQNSSRYGIAGQLAFLDLHGLDEDYLTKYVSRVNAVTPEEVQRITKKYLKADEMTIVVVGDRSVIDSQLEAFGPIEE